MKIINFEIKKVILLRQKSTIFAKKSSNINTLMIKVTVMLETTFIILITTDVLNMPYTI